MDSRIDRLLSTFETILSHQGKPDRSTKRLLEISELRHQVEKAIEDELTAMPQRERIIKWEELELLKRIQFKLHQE